MRRSIALLGSIVVAACVSDRLPTRPDLGRPSFAIEDAAHNINANPFFYWLPPMVPAPTTSGVFDPTQSPVVQICLLSAGACVAGEPLATFTMSSGPGSVIRVSTSDEHYIVNWHTDQFSLTPGATYRITVLIAGVPVGFADVLVGKNASELKNVNTDEFVPLVDDRTLPIKFRLEQGVTGVFHGVVTNTGGTFVTPDQLAGVEIPPNALPPGVTSIELVIARIPHEDFAPGTGPLNTTLAQYPYFYDFATVPDITFAQEVLVGLCQIEDPTNPFFPPEEIHGRLQLAHPDPNDENAVELLARLPKPDFIVCTGGYHGGLGGQTEDFGSPFAAVDPGDTYEGGPAEGSTIFNATFSASEPNTPPGPPEVGMWQLDNAAGEIFVRSAVGDLTDLPVHLNQVDGLLGGLDLIGTVAGTPPTTGVWVARWRSLVHSSDIFFAPIVLRDANFNIIASLEYRPNGLLSYSTPSTSPPTAPTSIGIGWVQNVSQLFEITVDLAEQVTSLRVNGVLVPGFESVPFVQSGASSVARIAFELGGTTAQSVAWDDISIYAAELEGAPEADLVIESFTHSPTSVTSFHLTTLNAVVLNAGAATAPPTSAAISLPGEEFAPSVTVPSLAPGQRFTVTRQICSTPPTQTATAFVAPVAGDDETNNSATHEYAVAQGTDPIVDGHSCPDEWNGAQGYGPFAVNLPGGATTTATLLIKNTTSQIFTQLAFAQDLSNHGLVIYAIRMDENADNQWNLGVGNGEDGFVAQQRVSGSRRDRFFDEFFTCQVSPCQGQRDDAWGGTNDGSTKSRDGGQPTVIEVAHGINTPDPRDASLAAGQTLKFLILINIGTSSSSLVTTFFPGPGSTSFASYLVQ